MKIIFDYNRTIFNPEKNEFYPLVFELLGKLSQKNELFLISRNEIKRKSNIKKFALSKFFKKIKFVENKSKKVFSLIAKKREKVIVIGDSIQNEIKIGNQLGFITIRIIQGKFSSQVPKNKDEVANYEINSLDDLEKIIKKYE